MRRGLVVGLAVMQESTVSLLSPSLFVFDWQVLLTARGCSRRCKNILLKGVWTSKLLEFRKVLRCLSDRLPAFSLAVCQWCGVSLSCLTLDVTGIPRGSEHGC